MGLIKAIAGAAGGALADSWREYFYCEALSAEVLAAKAQKRTSKKRSSNTKGEENIISNGAIIAVNDGQCMMIVEQGKVAEFCAEPGEFIWDNSTEPSLFYGSFGEELGKTFSQIGKRFTFGGDTAKDQRIYFFNTKEIPGNKYGTPNPVPFRVIDANIGLDIDISIRCFGEYSYKITNPMLFYTNVCGNVEDTYIREAIDSQLKTELLTALQPAFAKISETGIRYSALPGHTTEISNALNDELSEKWGNDRGIEISNFGISSVKASDEDEAMIKELQKNAVLRNPTMAAATLTGAQAAAMQSAAKNENGAAMAFMGMNMASSAGAVNANQLYAQGMSEQTVEKPAASGGWKCTCGAVNTGAFCIECGSKNPNSGWTCSCGTINKGKFCAECGAKKPAGALLYKCDKCGWEPEDPQNPPKFCPECGDKFDDNDIK